MPYPYNVSNNGTSIFDMIVNTSLASNSMVGVVILLVFCGVVFLTLSQMYRAITAFYATSFLTVLISTLMFGMGILAYNVWIISVVILLVATFIMWMVNS